MAEFSALLQSSV